MIRVRGASATPLDFHEPYLQAVFEFIGITDIKFIHAENLAMGIEERQQSLAAAHIAIKECVETWQTDNDND